MNTGDAKRVAFGSIPAITLASYYDAWQWLYDHGIMLSESDMIYIDKLICDGVLVPKGDYFNDGITGTEDTTDRSQTSE